MIRRVTGSRWVVPWILLSSLLGTLPASAQPTRDAEYRIKAAFLFNFVKFVEWPDDKPVDSPYEVCVLGEDPFGRKLEETFGRKEIKGRRVSVTRLSEPSNVASCHIVFVATTDQSLVDETLDRRTRASVLTVGDSADFLERGGMIQFLLDDSKIRFAINNRSAVRSRLRISSRLLRLATPFAKLHASGKQ